MRKPSQMYPIVEKWLASPKGKQLFCEQEGLPISVLNYWVSHYNRHKRQKGTKTRVCTFAIVRQHHWPSLYGVGLSKRG